jgi:hypothetical protein
MVYSVEGNSNNPENLRSFWFDCQGHYRDQTGGIGPTLFAPPRSVAGMLSNICNSPRTPPRPDYRLGFSEGGCE